jgi:hypothetical protein
VPEILARTVRIRAAVFAVAIRTLDILCIAAFGTDRWLEIAMILAIRIRAVVVAV